MKELNLLAITNISPLPVLDGASLRVFNLITNLPNYWRIDIICELPKDDFSKREINKRFRDVCFIESSDSRVNQKLNNYKKILNYFLTPKTLFALNLSYSNKMNELIKVKIKENIYNAIICFGASNYGFYLSDFNNLNITCDVCDSTSLYIKSILKTRKMLSKEWFSYIYAYLYNIKWERKYLNNCKKIIIISERDKMWLSKSIDESKIYVISNGVDTNYYNPLFVNPGNEKLVVFTGVMDYEPNHDAMVNCLKNIWPIIKMETQDAKLKIVGRNPRKELLDLARKQKDVYITGEVKDIRKEVKGASVFLCPIRIGAGMKNKILEAMASGIPVVTTDEGTSGIEFEKEKVVYVANSERELALRTVELLNKRETWEKLSKAARELVVRKYSWQSKGEKLSKILLK